MTDDGWKNNIPWPDPRVARVEQMIQAYVDGSSDKTLPEMAQAIVAWVANPCDKIFDHKWLSPSCVTNGCRSLNTRTLLGQIEGMEHNFDEHTNSWVTGFCRARKMAADMVRANLDPAVAQS